jgi:pto-interacting protein 1
LHKGIVFQFHLLLQVQFISRLEHNNVVQLLSYCIEGNVRGLVYEYSSRGSLHDILHGKKGAVGAQPGQALSWAQRVSIALSSAEGLEFINEKAEHCITHRIIKSRNILLFDNDVAKVIGDFGVFKSNPDDKINPDPLYYLIPPDDFDGYGAPELLMTGEFSNKSEVFSFGVVLLELLTGRKARDRTQPCAQQDLLSWVWRLALIRT